MAPQLRYPGSKRGPRTVRGSTDQAILEALREADERTVEVYDGGGKGAVLLARYEKRAVPLYPPDEPPEAA